MLRNVSRRFQAGVTLVELMIAMVVGLIVVGAAIGLIVALMRSNSETIHSARLSQEMRALADLTTMEIRRARGLVDPLANVGQGGAAATTCNAVTPSADGQCLTFAYGCTPLGTGGEFRVIRRSGTNLEFGTATTALDCSVSGTRLNSDELVIQSVNFRQTPTGAISMTLQGRLASDPNMSRTLTRVIWPRSAPVVP
jgi:prepilin-type N-terminal cleavage/methylation domain-containing protein